MNKYIKVDDVMTLINTSNRGNCDYFIVDKIEELCMSDKTTDEVEIRANAIDEFAERLHELCGYEEDGFQYPYLLHESRIDEIAEQMKAGGIDG